MLSARIPRAQAAANNLTPGAACRIAERGFMRLCCAAPPLEVVLEGIARVGRVLG